VERGAEGRIKFSICRRTFKSEHWEQFKGRDLSRQCRRLNLQTLFSGSKNMSNFLSNFMKRQKARQLSNAEAYAGLIAIAAVQDLSATQEKQFDAVVSVLGYEEQVPADLEAAKQFVSLAPIAREADCIASVRIGESRNRS
jgi:hypothetical protein